MQLYFFSAKHGSQCSSQAVAFGGVFLDGNTTAEVSEDFDIQHSYLIPYANQVYAPRAETHERFGEGWWWCSFT
jgi:hypothetical protein